MVEKALRFAAPLQLFLDNVEPTHGFLLNKALKNLREENFKINHLEKYYPLIYEGMYSADRGWQNVTHYFNPKTKKGLAIFLPAPKVLELELNNFKKLKAQKNSKAFWHFGRAAHILQDLCEPHHLLPTFLAGHKKFERWVGKNLKIISKNLTLPSKLKPLLTLDAQIFCPKILEYYELVESEASELNYYRAAKELLAFAVELTSLLFLEHERFFKNIEE